MATRTKKSGQRKALVVGLAAFASVCLIATGFAAWVISAKAEEKKTGNVNIGTVSSADVKITVDQEDKNNKDTLSAEYGFSFNPKATDETGRVRYDGQNAEQLEVTLSGTVGPQRFVTSFTIKLDLTSDGKTADEKLNSQFTQAETDGYITLPDCFKKPVELFGTESYEKADSSDDNAVAKFNYAISFGWGEKFGNENPGKYYDEIEAGRQVSDADRKKTLNGFYKTLTGNDPVEGTTEAPAVDANLKFLITLTADTAKKEDSSKVGN